MEAAIEGRTDTVIALVKAKASIDDLDTVRVGLAVWMVVCAEVEHHLGLRALEPTMVEMSGAYCCTVIHADVI